MVIILYWIFFKAFKAINYILPKKDNQRFKTYWGINGTSQSRRGKKNKNKNKKFVIALSCKMSHNNMKTKSGLAGLSPFWIFCLETHTLPPVKVRQHPKEKNENTSLFLGNMPSWALLARHIWNKKYLDANLFVYKRASIQIQNQYILCARLLYPCDHFFFSLRKCVCEVWHIHIYT